MLSRVETKPKLEKPNTENETEKSFNLPDIGNLLEERKEEDTNEQKYKQKVGQIIFLSFFLFFYLKTVIILNFSLPRGNGEMSDKYYNFLMLQMSSFKSKNN